MRTENPPLASIMHELVEGVLMMQTKCIENIDAADLGEHNVQTTSAAGSIAKILEISKNSKYVQLPWTSIVSSAGTWAHAHAVLKSTAAGSSNSDKGESAKRRAEEDTLQEKAKAVLDAEGKKLSGRYSMIEEAITSAATAFDGRECLPSSLSSSSAAAADPETALEKLLRIHAAAVTAQALEEKIFAAE